MFYQENLHTAVKEAIRDSKLVASFVTDHGEESQSWENEFLQDQQLKKILSERSVLLKLEAGSIEAGYLAAIFPLPKTPALIIIQNGQLREYISPGVTKEDFVRRALSVFKTDISAPSIPALIASDSPIREQTPRGVVQPSNQAATSSGTSNTFQTKPEKSIDSEAKPTTNASNVEQAYVLMQKKRQQEIKDERARILKRLEEDKVTRRQEATLRKGDRQNSSKTLPPHNLDVPCTSTNSTSCSSSSRETCAVLIRLFDGSALRTRFSSKATLSGEVRAYILTHEPAISDRPYIFKHMLTPAPNRTIEAAEESHTLLDLGCMPSATFILVPIDTYADAYTNKGNGVVTGGIIEGVANSGWRAISGGLRMITGTLGSYIGAHGVDDRAENINRVRENSPASSSASTPADLEVTNERKLAAEQQFYNGNSVNFQPLPKNDHERRKNE